MANKVRYIIVPPEWESDNDWDSHREALYLSLIHLPNNSRVVEFGSGYGSTPLLRSYCSKHASQFYSFDTDNEWSKKVSSELVSDFKKLDIGECDLLFIDGKPGEERKYHIELNRVNAKIIVAHDTEDGADYVYGMRKILCTFKYRFDYAPEGRPQTTIISNTIDVTKWKDHPSCTSSLMTEK
jgi:hypothetical protein